MNIKADWRENRADNKKAHLLSFDFSAEKNIANKNKIKLLMSYFLYTIKQGNKKVLYAELFVSFCEMHCGQSSVNVVKFLMLIAFVAFDIKHVNIR